MSSDQQVKIELMQIKKLEDIASSKAQVDEE